MATARDCERIGTVDGWASGRAAAAVVLVLAVFVDSTQGVIAVQPRSGRFHRLSYMDDYIIIVPSGSIEDSRVGRLHNVTRRSACAQACMTEERCSSFFHHRAAGDCVLHSVVFLGRDEATPRAGVTYWRLSLDSCSLQEDFFPYRPLGLCYKYHSLPVFWDEARTLCSQANTSLIKVDTVEKFDHLYIFLRSSSATRQQHFSIGLSDESGVLRYEDGQNATYLNWASGEPSDVSENCTTMAWFYYFKWNDVPCAANAVAKYYFLCQKAP